jgi:hypothetical protein
VEFSYSSDTRGSRIGLACSILITIFLALLWAGKTPWPLNGDMAMVLPIWTVTAALLVIGLVYEVFWPVERRAWIRDGVFGWHAPRRHPSKGEVPLNDLVAIDLDEGIMTFQLRSGVALDIQPGTFPDPDALAKVIAAERPGIRLRISGEEISDLPAHAREPWPECSRSFGGFTIPSTMPSISFGVFIIALHLALGAGFLGGYLFASSSKDRSARSTSVPRRSASRSSLADATPRAAGKYGPAFMRAVAAQIAAGDQSALTRLEEISAELYQDIDYHKEKERLSSNLVLMTAAFDVLGKKAGAGSLAAFEALRQSLGMRHLRSFAPDGLATAAAAGHAEALDILLHYEEHGILLSSAVFALAKPAAKNNEQAVIFLVDTLTNPNHKSLWHGASQGLIAASHAGNPQAKAALAQYASRRKAK